MSTSARRRKVSSICRRGLFALAVVVYLVSVLFPYYWMVATALKPREYLFASPPYWFPPTITFQHFKAAFVLLPLGRYLLNSTIVATAATLISVTVAAMAGYALSRIVFKGSSLIIGVLLLTYLLPGVVTIIPFYFWMMQLNLINTYIGLILPYVSFAIPFCIMMLRGYFKNSCPVEIEEAAMIDGCSRWGAFWRVVIPVSVPGLIATGFYTFMLSWNEFMWASIMMSRGTLKTVSVGLRDLIGESGQVQFIPEFMATSVISTLPVLILFLLAQKYTVRGLTAGAVKG